MLKIVPPNWSSWFNIVSTLFTSILEIASSRNKISGFRKKALMKDIFCICPEESVFGDTIVSNVSLFIFLNTLNFSKFSR